jgi:hypothetical protein
MTICPDSVAVTVELGAGEQRDGEQRWRHRRAEQRRQEL